MFDEEGNYVPLPLIEEETELEEHFFTYKYIYNNEQEE